MTEVDRHINVAFQWCPDFTFWAWRGYHDEPHPSSGVSGTMRNISLATLRLARPVRWRLTLRSVADLSDRVSPQRV